MIVQTIKSAAKISSHLFLDNTQGDEETLAYINKDISVNLKILVLILSFCASVVLGLLTYAVYSNKKSNGDRSGCLAG